MLHISKRAQEMPASAIRKLVPLSDAAEASGVTVYHLNVGAPDIASPACALEAVKSRAEELHHVSYTNSAGLIELRRGMVEKYYKPLGLDITTAQLLLTVGGSEAFATAMQAAAGPGEEIIVVEPFYTNYQTYAFLNGITLKAVHSDIREGFRVPDISAFEALLTPATRAVLLSNPCNPSGKLFTREEMLKIGDFCRRHDLFLICDEVYREFCYTDEPYFSALCIPGCEQNVIIVDSVSKRYNLCGSRVGCIVSRNGEVMACALKYAQARLCPPLLGQYAALGALDAPAYYFKEVRDEYIRRRDCALEALNSMPGVYAPMPYGAFYTVAELPVADAGDFAKWLLTDFRDGNETLMVTPAASFYKTPGAGDSQVRIAYVLEQPRLRRAMELLQKALTEYGKCQKR